MLKLQTELEGKTASFGIVSDCIRGLGYNMGGNWDYDKGCFDHILCQEGGETIYIRIPFFVTDGELDDYGASIKFGTPYIIKHVVHVGLDRDGDSLLDATGFSQFQQPIDKDGKIINKNRWIHAGEVAVRDLLDCMYEGQALLKSS
ncbi:YugN family protein [Sporosarcina highlanderae]|uniref:YugN family protein n=1 Tax=Sporosarcina highlanderae TaxID=3035916 RepID=A0ABT8JNF2_9BACL|nr:YugN family protein [Sporosarcina highlanderae]MDN4606686.1 YugN family protein [Sporosarcina highlanderae]